MCTVGRCHILQEQQLMKLEGVVTHCIFENPETGYAVFEVDAGGTDVVVSGNVGSVDAAGAARRSAICCSAARKTIWMWNPTGRWFGSLRTFTGS